MLTHHLHIYPQLSLKAWPNLYLSYNYKTSFILWINKKKTHCIVLLYSEYVIQTLTVLVAAITGENLESV